MFQNADAFALLEQQANEMAADESRPAGDQNIFLHAQ